MWFLISNNFDLKLETLILLDKIGKSRFREKDLERFISNTESSFLEDMYKSNITTDPTNENIELGESIRMDNGSGDVDNQNLYKTVELGGGNTLPLNNRHRSFNVAPTNKEEDRNFMELSQDQRKKWLLDKIMRLNISSGMQSQLVDRLEMVLKSEEKQRILKQSMLEELTDKVTRLQSKKSVNQLEETLLLGQLESKEGQLMILESDFRKKSDKVTLLEKEKNKIQKTFMNEVFSLQTGLDQRLLKIETLETTNKKLEIEKVDLEEMVEEYKKYSDTCKERTKQVEEEKYLQIKEIRKELDLKEEESQKTYQDLTQKFHGEKLILEETIKELMFKNKVD